MPITDFKSLAIAADSFGAYFQRFSDRVSTLHFNDSDAFNAETLNRFSPGMNRSGSALVSSTNPWLKSVHDGLLNVLNGNSVQAATVPLSINNVSLTEGDSGTSSAVFTVALAVPQTQPLTVNYAIADGTAIAGSDYTATSGVLTFAANETRKTITVAIAGDTLIEPDETFSVNLSVPMDGAVLQVAQGTGTILSDDPTLLVNDVAISEGNNGASSLVFTVNLSSASTQSVTVDYATANDTATAGEDYTATNGTLTFNPGETSQTISVPILGDTIVENNETFVVNLSNAVNAAIADNQGIGTIQNDEPITLPPIVLTPQVSGFSSPVHIANAGDGSNRLFVVEQAGRIRIIQDGIVLPTPFLDITNIVRSGGEEGLLSVAFPPDYVSKRYFYVYYTDQNGDNVVACYQLTADDNVAESSAGQIILTMPHPTFSNHNGGQLAFGADGYLYIGSGDGGGGGDPDNNAQNLNSLLGKILRIDTESPGTITYRIPSSNPFSEPGDSDRTTHPDDPTDSDRDEIWALGLRNPWRFSFDRQTGDLYIGDVGQGAREEVDFQPAASLGGENYGWKIMEGSVQFSSGDTTGLVLPVAEYDHSQGRSITGGFVYRGTEEPTLQGIYFYADFTNGRIWGLQQTQFGNQSGWKSQLILDSPYGISSFGQDQAGNLYVADYSAGDIYKITT
ncbi:MAG: hypothetical protein HC866_17920 [Leptolyngbyaceae cyanobacterium RU_5_1]|nr:hypothetical protein [Leptolyngbyaceae cyanobacterium RU_5_1]